DDMETVGQEWDEVPEHVARGREAMKQQQIGRVGRFNLTIEDLQAVQVGGAIFDGSHRVPLTKEVTSAAAKGATNGRIFDRPVQETPQLASCLLPSALRDSPKAGEYHLVPASIPVTTGKAHLLCCRVDVRAALAQSAPDVCRIQLQ